MLIEIKEGMNFQDKEGNYAFQVRKMNYYYENELEWVAVTTKFIYPLSEIYLKDYIPNVNGKWINEENEYIY